MALIERYDLLAKVEADNIKVSKPKKRRLLDDDSIDAEDKIIDPADLEAALENVTAKEREVLLRTTGQEEHTPPMSKAEEAKLGLAQAAQPTAADVTSQSLTEIPTDEITGSKADGIARKLSAFTVVEHSFAGSQDQVRPPVAEPPVGEGLLLQPVGEVF